MANRKLNLDAIPQLREPVSFVYAGQQFDVLPMTDSMAEEVKGVVALAEESNLGLDSALNLYLSVVTGRPEHDFADIPAAYKQVAFKHVMDFLLDPLGKTTKIA